MLDLHSWAWSGCAGLARVRLRCDGMGRDGPGWDVLGWDRLGGDRLGGDRMCWADMGCNGVG
jgi:hypothetical protein